MRSPTTSITSRGNAADGPPELCQSGVPNSREWSSASGRRTVTPSDSSSSAKPSSSSAARFSSSGGHWAPPRSRKSAADSVGIVAWSETCHGGIAAPSIVPTIASSSGSHSLCADTAAAVSASAVTLPPLRLPADTTLREEHGVRAVVAGQVRRDLAAAADGRHGRATEIGARDPAPVPRADQPLVRPPAPEAERAAAVRALVEDEEQPAVVLEDEVAVVAEEHRVVLARVQDCDRHASTVARLHSAAVRACRPCRPPAGPRIASSARSGNGGVSAPPRRTTPPHSTQTTAGTSNVLVPNR